MILDLQMNNLCVLIQRLPLERPEVALGAGEPPDLLVQRVRVPPETVLPVGAVLALVALVDIVPPLEARRE